MKKTEQNIKNNDLIWYDSRYWLADTFNAELYGGGWFAYPIYENEEGLEVRPAGGGWCYKINGAIMAEGLTNDQKRKIYESWIKHLEWTCKMIDNFPKEIEKYKKQISYFHMLCKKV